VIVTVATVSNYERSVRLVDSVQRHLKNNTVVIYDLGLGSYELVKVCFCYTVISSLNIFLQLRITQIVHHSL